jgi:alpha-tubulin suppressor-like RCC1 family protein
VDITTDFACGLTPSGAAYCWGNNNYGQLGTGTTITSASPVAVAGGLTFVALSVGFYQACGLTLSGAAYCWGDNSYGELGNGTTTGPQLCGQRACSLTPSLVAGGLTFATVSAKGDVCGVTTSGVAYCWGWNGEGELGDGTTTSSNVPIKVAGQP